MNPDETRSAASMNARQYHRQEMLRNGLQVVIRAARPDDAARLVEAFSELQPESVYKRFFSPKKEITEAELRRFREIDFDTHVNLLCTTLRDGREIVIASGIYVRVSEDTAELAFIVEEDYQRHGISKRLLSHLGELALASGIKRFSADVLAQNAAMLGLFQRCGWPMKSSTSEGIAHVTLELQHA
jgi:RimJ/RimL family protein N-acetyltransferase